MSNTLALSTSSSRVSRSNSSVLRPASARTVATYRLRGLCLLLPLPWAKITIPGAPAGTVRLPASRVVPATGSTSISAAASLRRAIRPGYVRGTRARQGRSSFSCAGKPVGCRWGPALASSVMRSPPPDLVPQQLEAVLAEGWGLRPASLEYLPVGAGSHHWTLTDGDGQRHFVTVDDLDNKDWIGGSSEKVRDGLGRAYRTAVALRDKAGLQFVMAPVAARDGEPLRRVDDRYTASVFPFLAGRSHGFGPFADARLRDSVLDMICALHQSTPIVRDCAPRHALRFAGREDLHAFLASPRQTWESGPFAEAARSLLAPHAADLAQLVMDFDRLVESTRRVRAHVVITHGEPHPANV